MSIYTKFIQQYPEFYALTSIRSKMQAKHMKQIASELMQVCHWANTSGEAFYCLKNDVGIRPTCIECTGSVRFDTGLAKYATFCSNKCMANNNQVKESKELTTLKNYGVTNPSLSSEVQSKMRKTWLDNYGVDHPSKVDAVQMQKVATCLSKFGVNYTWQAQEVKDKTITTMQLKYGVDHALQHPEFFDRAMVNSHKVKQFTTKSGATYKVQGYEGRALNVLESNGIAFVCGRTGIPTIKYTLHNKRRVYFPDILLPDVNVLIEVKSPYTLTHDRDKVTSLFDAVINSGYEFQVWVFDVDDMSPSIIKSTHELDDWFLQTLTK